MRARGIALVAVLWIVGLLALLAISSLTLVQSQARATRIALDRFQSSTIRDAAVLTIVRALTDPNPSQRPVVNARRFPLTVLDTPVPVSIEGESGRIDLNHADDALITALLISQGVAERDADDFLAKLRDWQDADEIRRPGGAEAIDYRQAGLSYTPRNASLESVDELFQLYDINHIPLKCLLSAFTVYSGAGDANARYAGPQVKAALAWAERNNWGGRQWNATDSLASQPAPEASYAGEVIRIHFFEATRDSTAMTNDVVLRLTGDERAPTLIYTIENRANIAGDSRNCPAMLK